ncbi:MAG TPA: rhomboid family intramembrane serine protease [Steroidobacteraceae bacterium]|nr:rhomboid family intramembrane serine protease [Steroidobacteraceae bacterium]
MVSLLILIAIVLISAAGLARPALIERAVLRPYLIAQGTGYARLVSSGFVHADVGHLLFNLITFFSFAFPLERVIGSARMLVLYFSGLLVSGLGTCFQHRNEPGYASLGASGAILAVLFASILYFPNQRLYVLPIPLPIPAPLFALLYLAFTWYSARNSRGRINHDAHLFGALTGIVFVAVTDPRRIAALMRLINPG